MLRMLPPRCKKPRHRKVHIQVFKTRITESLLFIVTCDCCPDWEVRAWGWKPAVASAWRHIKKDHQ